MTTNEAQLIIFSSDHGGIELKNSLIAYAKELNYQVFDSATTKGESVDYPDEVKLAYQAFNEKNADFMVLICGSGVGVSIAANRYLNIRAVLTDNPYIAKLAREHNQVNCLCMGQRLVGIDLAKAVLKSFLDGKPDLNERHQRRVNKLGGLCQI